MEIVGEGYFSVAKDTRKPFKVVSSGQVVEVLGTEFNISAYPDDSNTKTTLMSGSVRVAFSGNMEKELVPGQQSVLRGTVMEVRQVETGPYTAWKEGRFVFEGKTFTEIMRELARWYDIDIHYEGEIPEVEFYGDAFRNDNLAIVLAMLESASIDYELKPGRKLMISGKKGGR